MSDFFEENHWYSFKDSALRKQFADISPVNGKISRVIGTAKFEIKFDKENSKEINEIRFEGEDEFKNRASLLNGDEGFFFSSYCHKVEFKYFEDHGVITDLTKDRIIVASNVKSDEYDSPYGFFVGGNNPTLFTLQEAKEHASKVIESYGPSTVVQIYRLETTAKVESVINFS